MIIALDGPAASGKGTLARRLAAHFGLPHLDTGLLYRATARALIEAGERFDPDLLRFKMAEIDLHSGGRKGAHVGAMA
jgi:cytidylate kinase